MSSFEELLHQARNQPNDEQLRKSLSYVVGNVTDHYYMVRFLDPFLSHCNSSSLNTFHAYLQNYQNSIYAMPSAIHNLVNESHTNERLLQVVYLLIEKF
jgi:hypothetical protein